MMNQMSFTPWRFLMGVLAATIILPAGLAWAAVQPDQGPAMAGSSPAPEKRLQVQEAYGRLPLYFIENRGQVDKRVKFYAQSGGQTTWFTKDVVVVSLSRPLEKPKQTEMMRRPGPPTQQKGPGIQTTTVGLSPVGLRKGVKLTALEPQEHRVNYFIGNDPKKWHRDIPTYGAVVYLEAYKGIDLKFYGDGRQLEYDIIVKAGADPNQVKFQYAGVQGLEVTPRGDLAIKLPEGGTLVQKKPLVYQEIAGTRVALEGKFKLHGSEVSHTYGFEVAAYDKKAPLIIDPVIMYSTYLGGTGVEVGHAIKVDAAGCAYVAGVTTSRISDSHPFPTVNAISGQSGPQTGGYTVCFISKFNAAGNGLLYSTYLGGKTNWDGNAASDYWGVDLPYYRRVGLDVDSSGCAYITAPTWTKDFPTTVGAAYTTRWPDYTYKYPGSAEGFVTKLTIGGNNLIYSTYMRGDGTDEAKAIAMDSQGNAYITGYTESGGGSQTANPNSSLNGTYLTNYYTGSGTAFITKLNPTGSSFLWTKGLVVYDPGGVGYGGSGAYGIVAEPINAAHSYSGGVWVTGETLDSHFPLLNPLTDSQGKLHNKLWGQSNAFVTWLDQSGTIRFSTYWGGGSGIGSIGDYTYGFGIARDTVGDIYVCGETNNAYYPTTTGAIQTGYLGQGHDEAIFFKLTNRWSSNTTYQAPQLVYSTYLGGGGDGGTGAYAVAVDRLGNAYLTGNTNENNFPLKSSPYTTHYNNVFVTKIGYSNNKMWLIYSIFLGPGFGGNAGYGIVHDGKGSVYVTGVTGDDQFPLRNAYQKTLDQGAGGAGGDAFVTKIKDSVCPPYLLLQ